MDIDSMAPVRKRRVSFGRYAFFLPAVILMLLFFIYPILLTIIYSFTNTVLTGSAAAQSMQFVGFANYTKMFSDPDVLVSIENTLIFLVGSSLIGQQLFGFIIALLMKNKATGFRRVIGIAVLTGWILPEIIVAFCMLTFLGDNGTLNVILSVFRIKPVSWLYTFPMFGIIIANIWHGTAFSMLIFQAALDEVPKEMEEAAVVDGANRVNVLFRITIPYIKGYISTNMILNTLQTLGVFGLIYTMTGGGPSTKTTTLPIFMYNEAFINYQIGYGTAISMLLLGIGIVLSILYAKTIQVKT